MHTIYDIEIPSNEKIKFSFEEKIENFEFGCIEFQIPELKLKRKLNLEIRNEKPKHKRKDNESRKLF